VSLVDSPKKEKRGAFGYGVHGHHQHHYEHFDDYSPPAYQHHHHPVGPPPIPPPQLPPLHFGAHAHTTVVKKVAIPVHVPYPVKVKKLTSTKKA
jgi:hypothetical protein